MGYWIAIYHNLSYWVSKHYSIYFWKIITIQFITFYKIMHLAAFFHEILINAAVGQKRGSHIRLGDLFWIIQFMTHLFPRFLILLHRCMHFIFLHSKFEKFLEDPPKNFYCKLAYLVQEIPISLRELGGSAPPNFCIFRYQFLPLSTKNVNNTFNRKFW